MLVPRGRRARLFSAIWCGSVGCSRWRIPLLYYSSYVLVRAMGGKVVGAADRGATGTEVHES